MAAPKRGKNGRFLAKKRRKRAKKATKRRRSTAKRSGSVTTTRKRATTRRRSNPPSPFRSTVVRHGMWFLLGVGASSVAQRALTNWWPTMTMNASLVAGGIVAAVSWWFFRGQWRTRGVAFGMGIMAPWFFAKGQEITAAWEIPSIGSSTQEGASQLRARMRRGSIGAPNGGRKTTAGTIRSFVQDAA